MRYSWRKRVAAAILCGMVAVSSVNTSAFAEVTGADAGAALEELAAAAGALTGGTAGEAAAEVDGDAEKSNELRQLSFVGSGVRVFKDGVELNSLVEVYEQDEVTLMLVAKQGYALGDTATLVTNVEDPIITQFAVEDATVVIPAGTLITDGTLNLTATLTGEPVEEEAAEGDDAESAEAAEDEDLTVSLEDLTNAQVEGSEGDEAEDAESAVEQIGDGASDLRYTLEASSSNGAVLANGTELFTTSDEVTLTQMTAEADVSNPTFEGYAYVDGAVIKVTAAEGAVPAGTRVEASRVTDEKYAAAVNDAMGDVLGAYVAYNITLVDEAGNEVQPTVPVNVAIFDALAEEAGEDEATAVFHVSDDAREVQVVTARQTDAQVQSFDVEHFSIYLVGIENNSYFISGTGATFSTPYILWGANQVTSATFTCDSTEEGHVHKFWTDNKCSKNGTSWTDISSKPQFTIQAQGELFGKYYCVIQSTTNVYTGQPQRLFCGVENDINNSSITYINNRNNTNAAQRYRFSNIFAFQVNTTNVKIGAAQFASDLSNRGVSPMFNDLLYSYASLSNYTQLYWFVGAVENNLIYYWDSYFIRFYTGYALSDMFDYSDFTNVTNSNITGRSVGTVTLNDDAGTTASDYGYSAMSWTWCQWQAAQAQKYFRIKAKAEEPSEAITANNTVNKSQALKPGDTITFNVDVDPYTLDLTTDQNSEGTVLTKTSTVSVSAQKNTPAEDVITTSNEGVSRTASVSDYTTTTLYTSADTGETHSHAFEYVITRADCVAALKRANEEQGDDKGYNTATTYDLDLNTSVTTDYEAKLKTNGGYLTTTASNTVDAGTSTATVSKEHYVNYELTYKYGPAGVDPDDYPDAIKTVKDVNTQDGGKDNKTPFWEGEVVSFAGYSVGQIVEDKDLKGYWVFSGWVDDNGDYLTSDITMGTSDITVKGEWTFVSYEVHYEMDSWDYDGTFHAPLKSYVGTEAVHVDSTPNTYAYYQQVESEGGTTWEYVGSDHPVNAGTYKVAATWDYVITNAEKIAENEKNNAAGSGNTNGNADKNPEVEAALAAAAEEGTDGTEESAPGEDGSGEVATPTTKPADQGEITVESEFTINKIDVTIESPTASKYYDGYPLTAAKLTMTGNWIQSEQAKIEVVATGTQTLPNNGEGEAATVNSIVLMPALENGEETEALKLARAQAYASSSLFLAVAEEEDDEEEAEPTEEELAFTALLANYNITLKEGTLTVMHRTSSNKLPLEIVGATPTEALTYNGKDQEVAGYTVNGVASTLSEENVQTATFDMDEFTGHAQEGAGDGAQGSSSGSDSSSADGAGSAATQATWTLTGITAAGTGKDASTTPYTVGITAGDVAIADAAGNNVTSEFAWTVAEGHFTIDPVKLTVVSDSASRAYDTTTLKAHSYTITEGSFVRGEGFVDARITWDAAIKRVGTATNSFNVDNAWSGTTKQSNYEVTLEFGTLEVLATVDVSERMDVAVSAKSKQVEENHALQELSGFTSMVGDYATFTVESGEGTATVYVSGLTSYGSGTTPGKYEVAVTGTPVIYDSMDADKIDVTGCFNLTTYSGYLTIRKEGTNAVEFTNRAELSNKTYDGKSLVPVAEGLQKDTVVFYTLDAEVAAAAQELPGMTDEDGELVNNDAATGTEKDATDAGWASAITELIDAGDYQVWALGYKDGLFTPVETAEVHIKQRAITLVSDSATKAYDGVALTAATMPRPAASSLGWVAADLSKLEITATGSQKRPGTSANGIEVAAAGDFATEAAAQEALDAILKNYQLTKEPGELEVTALTGEEKIELNVVGSTGTSLTYNGQEQEVTAFTVNGTASTQGEDGSVSTVLIVTNEDGQEVGSWTVTGVTASGVAKDVKVAPEDWGADTPEGEEPPAFDATYPVEVTASALKVVDEDGEDVTAQFAATTANGSFEITKKAVVIASKSASKTYDLQELTYQYYRITSGGFVTGEGLDEGNIEWTGRRTSPGISANTFSLDNAWKAGTNPDNYAVTISTGTLTVNHITNDADKFEVVVKSKSDKQRLETDSANNALAVTLTGFESSITVNGKVYIPVRVSRNGFSTTLYVTNLRASVTAKTRGTHANKITGTAVVYDSLDVETRTNVAESIKVELREGALRLLGPLDDALVWANENDVTQLNEAGEVVVTTAGIDGTYYDGEARTPVVESKFYPGNDAAGQPLTTIYYTTSKEAAEAAEKDPGTVTGSAATAAEGDAAEGGTSAWTTTVPSFVNAGEHTFYAVGVRDDDVDTDDDAVSGAAAADESDASSDERVVNGKRYTEVETFTLTILKRTVTLSTAGNMKTYDGTKIDVPTEVTISGGENGFVASDRDKLEIGVEDEEFILPGTYRATITVEEQSAAGEDAGQNESQGEVATRAAGTGSDAATTGILGNYQIIKNPGQLDIDARVGDERFSLALDFPEMTYQWAGSQFKGGKLTVTSEYGSNVGEVQVLSEDEGLNNTINLHNGYITLANGAVFELANYAATFTVTSAGTKSYQDFASNILSTGSIYQVKESVDASGAKTYTRVGSGTAVTANFAQSITVSDIYVKQATGNVITSTESWLGDAANASASAYATYREAWNKLSAWSTWTFTGTSAPTIPAITALLGVGTTYYALHATEDGEAVVSENGEVLREATNEWYTWDQMKDLLVKPGTYTLSFKNSTTNYEDCFAFDALTVHILERTIATGDGAEITVYDPTSSAYGFVWDDNGNLLDAADKIVANRDGVPTTGANIEGLPVGPAVIMDPQVTYTGEAQQVKPVVVDDQGRLMVEGIHYTLSYEGDITNVGTAAVRITSIPGSGYNCDFTASFEIVASEYGSLKAAEKYTYVYAGGNDLAEPGIIANYGDSKVVYSLNGEEYETWAEVVEAMVNVGSYTLAIKTDGENYVTSEGTVVVEVQPLDMSATPQESIESVEVEAEDLAVNTVYVAGGDYSYSGEAYEPEVLIIDEYGNQLVYGRDYTTSVVAIEGRSKASARAVDEAIDAGSYALAVSYRGNYTGISYVAFSIDKVAGNEVLSTDASGVDGAAEGHLTEPTVVAKQEGSTFLYSVDGGAFVTWAQAAQQLTEGTHTLVAKAVHTNYLDAEGKAITVTIAARPASDTVTDGSTGSTGTAAGTTGSSSTGSSASGTSSSTGRTVQAAGTTTSTNAVSSTTETPTTEAVTVENLANNAASSTSSSSTTPEAQAAVTHATYAYLTFTIVTGMLLTAAYSLTVIKQRLSEAERLSA